MEEGGRERVPVKLILACCPLLLEHDIALKLNHGAMLSMGHSKHRKTGWGLSVAFLWSHTALAYPARSASTQLLLARILEAERYEVHSSENADRGLGWAPIGTLKVKPWTKQRASFHGALQRAKRSLSQGTRLMAEASRGSSREPWRDVLQVLKGTILTLEFYIQLSYLLNEGGNWR